MSETEKPEAWIRVVKHQRLRVSGGNIRDLIKGGTNFSCLNQASNWLQCYLKDSHSSMHFPSNQTRL